MKLVNQRPLPGSIHSFIPLSGRWILMSCQELNILQRHLLFIQPISNHALPDGQGIQDEGTGPDFQLFRGYSHYIYPDSFAFVERNRDKLTEKLVVLDNLGREKFENRIRASQGNNDELALDYLQVYTIPRPGQEEYDYVRIVTDDFEALCINRLTNGELVFIVFTYFF